LLLLDSIFCFTRCSEDTPHFVIIFSIIKLEMEII
jgi:hypothetical protein